MKTPLKVGRVKGCNSMMSEVFSPLKIDFLKSQAKIIPIRIPITYKLNVTTPAKVGKIAPAKAGGSSHFGRDLRT